MEEGEGRRKEACSDDGSMYKMTRQLGSALLQRYAYMLLFSIDVSLIIAN